MQHGSCECSKSELDVTAVPPTMTAMQEGHWTEHHPISALNNSAPIEFIFPPQTEKWTDLNQSFLFLKLKVTKDDGANLEGDTNVGVVNNLFHSLFSSIDLYLNNKLVTSNTDTYPYRAYIENLLSFNQSAKTSHLKALELWTEDTAGHMQGNTHDGDNAGWKTRKARLGTSSTVELMGRLHLDLFLQEKYLPNGMEIKLRLNKTSPHFFMFGAAEGKLQLLEATFHVRTVEVLPVLANDLNKALLNYGMKMPIRRVEVKTFTISTGLRSKVEDYLFQGQLPKRVIVGLVNNNQMNGTSTSNPFDFQHFNLSKLEVSVDGRTIQNKPFQPNFQTGECLRSYASLFQAMGSLGQNQSMGLTMDQYKNGYTLWGFDLTADQGSEGSHLHPIKSGNLRLELQFAQALAAVINVLVFAEFDNQIEINGLREVITDY